MHTQSTHTSWPRHKTRPLLIGASNIHNPATKPYTSVYVHILSLCRSMSFLFTVFFICMGSSSSFLYFVTVSPSVYFFVSRGVSFPISLFCCPLLPQASIAVHYALFWAEYFLSCSVVPTPPLPPSLPLPAYLLALSISYHIILSLSSYNARLSRVVFYLTCKFILIHW